MWQVAVDVGASLDALTEGLLRASLHPVLILNAAATIVAGNEAAAQVLGEPLDELVGRSALDRGWDLRDAAHRPILDTRIVPRLQFETSHASLRGTFELSRRDGSRIWLEAVVMPVFTEGNALAWIIASFERVSMSEERLISERRRARFTLINSILEGLSLRDEQEPLVDAIAERLCGRLGELVVIRSMEDGERLPIVADAGSTPAMRGLARSMRTLPPVLLGQGLSGHVSVTGRALVSSSEDFDGHMLDDWRPVMAGHGLASVAVLPIRWGGQVVGTLSIGRVDPREAFSQGELTDLEPLLDWIAHAMVSGRQAEEGRRAQGYLEALIAINRTAISSDPSLVADVAVRQLAAVIPGAAAAVHLVEPDNERTRFSAGAGFRGNSIRRSGSLSSGYLARVAAGTSVSIPDLTQVEDWDRPELLREEAAAGYAAVPIRNGSSVYGLLELFTRDCGLAELSEGLLPSVAAVLGGVLAVAEAGVARAERQPATPAIRGGYQLTPSEVNILRLVAEGLSNGEIAQRVHLSRETVKFHLSNLYRRLSVSNRAELVSLATKRGWV